MSAWVFGVGFQLVALLFVCMAPTLPMSPPGQLPFRMLQTIYAVGTVITAVYLAAQSMDDNPSGTLGFLKIANLEPRSWVAFRFAAVVIAYLPIWIMRLPVYVLVLSLGGVMLDQVLWLEAVQWMTFLTISSLALLVARYSATGMGLAGVTIVITWVWQAVLFLWLIVMAIIRVIQDRSAGGGDHPWAVAVGRLSLPRYFWQRPTDAMEWGLALAGFALHLVLAAILLRLLVRVVYFNVGTEIASEQPALTKAERGSTTRPSRRVSDDPLAWLVCHVHSGTSLRMRTNVVIIVSWAVLFLAFIVIREPAPRFFVIGNACAVTLLILAFKPSDCLSREVKGKTLSTLALLPLDGREIYEAWHRGARQLARPAHIAAAAGGLVLSFNAPEAAPYVWMVMAFTVLLLPEAAFLSNVMARQRSLIGFDFVQLLMNLWVLFLIGVSLAISLPVAIGINAWAGLVTLIGLLLVARSLLLMDFAGHIADRVEREQ